MATNHMIEVRVLLPLPKEKEKYMNRRTLNKGLAVAVVALAIILLILLIGCGTTGPVEECGTVIQVHRPTMAATVTETYTIVVESDTMLVRSNQRGLHIGDTICDWE